MTDERVHSLADLDSWHFEGVALAVLGHPVAHSISPPMHNAALSALAKKDPEYSKWRYFKFDIEPEQLPEAVPKFHRAGFRGLNLTIPHKIIAVDLIERIDPAAAEAAAVNTLRRTETGYEGFNTDGYGIIHAVTEDLCTTVNQKPVILLGAGGASRATAVACLRAGCPELWIGNRTQANLETLLEALAPVAVRTGHPIQGFDLADPPENLPADALVVNATSAGLKPGDPPPIDVARLPGQPLFYDMIYNPPETPLLREARERGYAGANGLSMLVLQGARSLEIWSGEDVSARIMRQACLKAMGRSA